MHDLTQTLKEPSSLQEKWACQPKRIIYSTYNRKHPSSCHWLIFQINLEDYYIILSIPENPQCLFNWKTTSYVPVFCTIEVHSEFETIYFFLLLMNFVNLNPPFLHRNLTSWISVRASYTDGTGFSTSST